MPCKKQQREAHQGASVWPTFGHIMTVGRWRSDNIPVPFGDRPLLRTVCSDIRIHLLRARGGDS